MRLGLQQILGFQKSCESRQGSTQQAAHGDFATVHTFGDFSMRQSGEPRPQNDLAIARVQAVEGRFELHGVFALAQQLAGGGGLAIDGFQCRVAQRDFSPHVATLRARSAQLFEDLVAGELEQPGTKAGVRSSAVGMQVSQGFATGRLYDV